MFSLLSAVLVMLSLGLMNAGTANAITYNQLRNGYYLGAPLCATPYGMSTANGTIITTWSCTGHDLQQWTYRSGGYIVHEASGKCLTPQGNASGSNGAVLTLWTCTQHTSQRFVDQSSPLRIFTQYGGKCITNKGGSMGDGVYLTLWACASGDVPEQTWSI
ncbi:RICIN domain-containing protein [Streptomyces flavidovirens]|uniref:RICIN domain-containing protein n=1 Tax=Streptomyces flavidovirens TaxID=67298 RepID=A0ABW6RNS9_9ACTN